MIKRSSGSTNLAARTGICLDPFMRFACLCLALLCSFSASAASTASAATPEDDISLACPVLRHGYGPFDYRSAANSQRQLVEGAHFFPDVENLKRNAIHPNRGYIVIPGSEIDYTLRAFPNHPRALLALSRLSLRDKTDQPQGTKAPVVCYFLNAIRFRPDDGLVHVIYGTHLLRSGKTQLALEELQKGEALSEENASVHYNLGLAYFELKRYPESLASAQRAYALGFPLPGLRDKLKKVGAWKDGPPPPLAKASAPSAAASTPAGETGIADGAAGQSATQANSAATP
ncbi:tetratricopeptide repeat protein [Niveibacterium sp. SC-1]|uniref:tetratricopeptide repeat protein n=1 Tax=Niveibacterium sp. SC-1 TaxID=3135646 RepID=UPI00311E0C35